MPPSVKFVQSVESVTSVQVKQVLMVSFFRAAIIYTYPDMKWKGKALWLNFTERNEAY